MIVVVKFQVLVAATLAVGGGGVMMLGSMLGLYSRTAWFWCSVISMIWLITVLNLLILSYMQSFQTVLQQSLPSWSGSPVLTSKQKVAPLRWQLMKWMLILLGGLSWSVFGERADDFIIGLMIGLIIGLTVFVSSILYGSKHQPMV